ncbi:MAG: LytR family transcriptional regulator [Ruminococcaceae bacterium]|nr:LytR family transcriptional regulator [Oscillospiraceae bacterium]
MGTKKKSKLFVAIIALILVAVTVAAGLFVADRISEYSDNAEENTTSSETQITVTTEPESLLPEVDPDSITWDSDYSGNSDGLINFLFIGQDRRENEGRQRSDAMILCSLNPETKELSMISFLRDLYVQIPGYEDNRLNAAYAYGGFSLLKESLRKNFDVIVDGCIEVDFENFKSIVDTIGGIEVELTAAEAEIVGSGVKEGVCHLDGSQTLTYARIRKIDSDFVRTKRQRNVLSAILGKVKAMDVTGRLGFVSAVLPMISTDMTDEQLMSLAMQLAGALDKLEVTTHCVPAEGAYKSATVRGMAVLIPDIEKNRKMIFEEYLPIN